MGIVIIGFMNVGSLLVWFLGVGFFGMRRGFNFWDGLMWKWWVGLFRFSLGGGMGMRRVRGWF